jgi:hypothetical protein
MLLLLQVLLPLLLRVLFTDDCAASCLPVCYCRVACLCLLVLACLCLLASQRVLWCLLLLL